MPHDTPPSPPIDLMIMKDHFRPTFAVLIIEDQFQPTITVTVLINTEIITNHVETIIMNHVETIIMNHMTTIISFLHHHDTTIVFMIEDKEA